MENLTFYANIQLDFAIFYLQQKETLPFSAIHCIYNVMI